MSGLARPIKGTHNARAYRLPQIPATLEPKPELNSAAFRQATPPHGNFMQQIGGTHRE
jgi:hypothetical protein